MKNKYFFAPFFGILGVYLVLINFFLLIYIFEKNLQTARARIFDFSKNLVIKIYGVDYMQARAFNTVAQLKDQIIPKEKSASIKEIQFSSDGYQKLLEHQKNIKLDEAQKDKFINFDVLLPCCGFEKTIWPEEENCACGHHLALYGLIKYMIEKGYDRTVIQKEINRWKYYFFPDDYLKEELKKRNLLNSATEKVLQEMQAKGSC
ncbi:MAG: hypothetical protein AB1465_02955 [Patescibacteria group bacterium]